MCETERVQMYMRRSLSGHQSSCAHAGAHTNLRRVSFFAPGSRFAHIFGASHMRKAPPPHTRCSSKHTHTRGRVHVFHALKVPKRTPPPTYEFGEFVATNQRIERPLPSPPVPSSHRPDQMVNKFNFKLKRAHGSGARAPAM